MQNKLAQLKEIIFDFNGFKQPETELKSTNNEYYPNEEEEEHGYEITQKYFNLLAKNEEPKQGIPDYSDFSEDEDEKELNEANREQLKEHKT
jgi:hypothetical protein